MLVIIATKLSSGFSCGRSLVKILTQHYLFYHPTSHTYTHTHIRMHTTPLPCSNWPLVSTISLPNFAPTQNSTSLAQTTPGAREKTLVSGCVCVCLCEKCVSKCVCVALCRRRVAADTAPDQPAQVANGPTRGWWLPFLSAQKVWVLSANEQERLWGRGVCMCVWMSAQRQEGDKLMPTFQPHSKEHSLSYLSLYGSPVGPGTLYLDTRAHRRRIRASNCNTVLHCTWWGGIQQVYYGVQKKGRTVPFHHGEFEYTKSRC